MNLQKCENGHFYDADKFENCPHCKEAGEESVSIKKESVEIEENKDKSKFGFRKRKKNEKIKNEIDDKEENNQKETQYLNIGTDCDNRTTFLHEDMENNNKSQKISQEFSKNVSQKLSQELSQQFSQAPKILEQEQLVEEKHSSLQAAYQATKDYDNLEDGKTVGYFSCGSVEPPVGFLICISGPDRGQYYELRSGNNFIGRAATMDVVIVNDKKVSRDKHANVLYDPKGRNYMLLSGEAKGLAYLKNELVLTPQKYSNNDIFQIGDTKLMLLSVCTNEFSWEE